MSRSNWICWRFLASPKKTYILNSSSDSFLLTRKCISPCTSRDSPSTLFCYTEWERDDKMLSLGWVPQSSYPIKTLSDTLIDMLFRILRLLSLLSLLTPLWLNWRRYSLVPGSLACITGALWAKRGEHGKSKIWSGKVKVMSKHSGEKGKRENACFSNKFQGHELLSRVWPVNTEFKKVILNQAFS